MQRLDIEILERLASEERERREDEERKREQQRLDAQEMRDVMRQQLELEKQREEELDSMYRQVWVIFHMHAVIPLYSILLNNYSSFIEKKQRGSGLTEKPNGRGRGEQGKH